MASLTDIRVALAASLADLPFQVSPRTISNPTVPSAHVTVGGAAGDIEYHHAMGNGQERWPFSVQVFVSLASGDIGASVYMDQFFEAGSGVNVKELIEADSTLGGACTSLAVRRSTGEQLFTFPDGRAAIGAEWHVDVYASGT